MRFGFFLREALRAMSRNAAPSLAAIVCVVLTAVVLGVFIPVVQATTGTANEVRGRVVVDVFITEKATDIQVNQLREKIVGLPNVKGVKFISKEDALARERGRNPEAFELLGTNPLPDSFRITPEDPDGVDGVVRGVQASGLPAIDEVRNREQDTDKILQATGVVKGLTGLPLRGGAVGPRFLA